MNRVWTRFFQYPGRSGNITESLPKWHTPLRRNGRFAVVLTVSLLWFAFPRPARAADETVVLSPDTVYHASILFVPALDDAFTFGLRSALNLPLGESAIDDSLTSTSLDVFCGYRWSFDTENASNLSAIAVFSWTPDFFVLPARDAGTVYRPGIQVSYSRRFMNIDYEYLLLGGFLEADLVVWDDAPTSVQRAANVDGGLIGVRLGAGVEGGVGWLFNLDPYMFIDIGLQVGFHYHSIEGAEIWSFGMTGILRFDWAFIDPY